MGDSGKFRNKYRIKSARKENYDYSSVGAYFVTICVKNKIHYFGNVVNGKMIFSELGNIAFKCWQEIPGHFPHVMLDAFVIMPNHVHGIVMIVEPQNFAARMEPQNFVAVHEADFASAECKNKFGPQSKNLASIIRGFKIGVKKYAVANDINFAWQSRYHDHIIRNQFEFERIQNYIYNNPLKWEEDKLNSK